MFGAFFRLRVSYHRRALAWDSRGGILFFHLFKAVNDHGAVETRPDVLSIGADGDAGAARETRLRRNLQSDAGQRPSRCAVRTRPRSRIANLRPSRWAR